MSEAKTDAGVGRAQPAWRATWDRVVDWLRTDAAVRWLLVAVLLIGGYLRLSHIYWDLGTHVHPDENFLTMVTSSMRLPSSLGEFLDSTRSPMNPYNNGYGLFVYGSLPIFLVRVAAEVANKLNQALEFWKVAPGVPVDMVNYGAVFVVGRALSALWDLGSVALLYFLARRLYRGKSLLTARWIGLLAAALYAFAPLPLQLSHFYTVDTAATFFTLVTLYCAVRVAQGGEQGQRGGGWGTYVALGASLGASLACRINLLPLVLIAVLAAGIRAWDDWRRLSSEQASNWGWLSTLLQATLFRLLLMILVAVAVFRVAQPYAFGGTKVLDFSFAPQWLSNMKEISRSTNGEVEMPPAHQWANRTPFVFPFVNMVVWGMGLPLGLVAWAGWLATAWLVLRALTRGKNVPAARPHYLIVAWVGGMFLWHGLQWVQSMRYYLPIYPPLVLLAAWLLWRLTVAGRGLKVDGWRIRRSTPNAQRPTPNAQRPTFNVQLRPIAYGLLACVTVLTILWGWAFMAIYRRPLTRITASRWMYTNIAPGSHIGIENWDEGLPLGVDGRSGYGAGGFQGLSSGDGGTMPMMWDDVPQKREGLYQWLNEADYIVISSNRRWASAPRMPLRFPMTIEYYRLMFEEKLGFKQVLHVKSFPTVFGIEFSDANAEEAWSVYDHPQVFIFQKTPEYSEALVRSHLDPIDLEQVIPLTTKQASQSPSSLYMSAEDAARQQTGGTWSEIFGENGLLNRSPALSALGWYLLLVLLGLVAFPITFVALRGLADRGYGLSKTLGVLLLAWLSWIGPSLKVVPYARWWIALSLGLLIGAAAAIGWRRRAAIVAFVRERRGLLLTEEAIFLVLFALFLLIRIGNPDLWHPARGGEKPMEFAYLNAVIRSTVFPPYDPWHAGGFMNYYYFGWVIVGTLVKLTGIVPWVAYNLAVPTLFALTGLGAFSVAFNLVDGDRATEFPGEEGPYQGMRVGSLLAGLAGAFFVAIIGNLGNAKLVIDQLAARAPGGAATEGGLAKLLSAFGGLIAVLAGRAKLEFPNDWWFWNASRVIPDTINEFPFFTFTYADLHAHMIALPLTLLALGFVVALVRNVGLGIGVLGIRDSESPDNTQHLHRTVFPGTARQGKCGAVQVSPISNLQSLISTTEPSPWCIPIRDLLPIILLGLVLGALRATNTWDFPTYALAGLAGLILLEAARRGRMARWISRQNAPLQEQAAFLFRALVSVLWRAVIMIGVAVVTFYPFTKNYATAYAGLQLWKETKTQIPDYLVVWGFFLALGLIYLLAELVAQAREGQVPGWLKSILPFVIVAGVLLVGAGWVLKARIWLIAVPMLLLAVVLAFGREIPSTRRLGLLLLALALAITVGVELLRQKDDIGRMNTVFKFYLQAWVLFGVSTAFGLAGWAARALGWRPGWRRVAWGVTAVLLALTLLYPAFAARAKVRDRFSAEASPHGLDGMAYMDRAIHVENGLDVRLADDKAAMLWLMRNVQGSPVVLEAQIPEYRWGSRFSIYTGLPTVQGWNWHQRQQRSVVPAVVERRVQHIQEIYSTLDLPRAQHLLETYNVSLIIVGELERAYYPPEGLAKFETLAAQGYLRTVYQGGAVTIYEIAGRGKPVQPAAASSVGPQPVPTPTPEPAATVEALPTAGTFASPQ